MKGWMILRWVPAAFLLAVSCISPIDFAVPDTGALLVVDGGITTDQGPYTVRLFKSFVVNDRYENPVAEFGAQLRLSDDEGNEEVFSETEKGVYSTGGAIRGTIGKAYTLHIRTLDGKEYESTPEPIKAPGTLDSLYYEYVSETQVIDGQQVPLRGFRIRIDASGSSDRNLLRWKWTGTYRVLTFPEQRTKITDRGPVPDPLPCSGYRYRDGKLTAYEACSCCTCWLNNYPDRPILSDEQFVSDGSFKGIAVAFVPLDRRLFHEKFHIEVEQQNLSDQAYEFWRAVRDQKDGATSLFQPPNARARSNLRCLTSDVDVLGYFSATAVSKKSLFLFPAMAPDLVLPIDTVKGSCLAIDKSATTQRPSFW